jgi:Raf kinase inhibitor-like YbhB/YbcL family protein
MKTVFILFLIGLTLSVGAACGGGSGKTAATATPSTGGNQTTKTMTMTTTAFAQGAAIPLKYTCDGDSVSPPLQWDEPPAGTQSLAVIVDDPDAPAGMFVHWVIYGLPPTLRGLPEGVSVDAKPSTGGLNGNNGAGKSGYTGPCPPSGVHHYFFRLYALDAALDATPGWTKVQLLQAMEGHILAQAELMGTYSRGQ